MRVQHVITTLDVGGAEVHLLSQVRGQVERGHEVRVAYLKGDGHLRPEFEAAGASEVTCVGPFGLIARIRAADLVHSHLLKADMLTAFLSLLILSSGKLVSSKHNDERALLNPIFSRIHGILGRVPRRTIILSKHVVEFFATHGRLPRARLRQVYYGLNPEPFEKAAALDSKQRIKERSQLGLDENDCILICVARFAPQKRHDLLLKAFAKAREELAAEKDQGQLRLLLVGGDPFGDGQQRAEVEAAKLGLDQSVSFLGIRRDVPHLYGLADAFVMYSEWEGLGLVFLEAMAASLPVVATGVSAVPEVVIDGETGLLAPFGDIDSMARAFVQLSQSAHQRQALGAAGHQRVLDVFGLDSMVDATLDIYTELKRGQPGRVSG